MLVAPLSDFVLKKGWIHDNNQRNATTTLPLAAGQTLAMVCVCYLVETSDGKHILIDSGLPADYTPPPATSPAEHEKNVLEQLTDLLAMEPLSLAEHKKNGNVQRERKEGALCNKLNTQ